MVSSATKSTKTHLLMLIFCQYVAPLCHIVEFCSAVDRSSHLYHNIEAACLQAVSKRSGHALTASICTAAEYDFRYNEREGLGVNDAERMAKAIPGIVGKRLTYRRTNKASHT